ncbi:sulfotransferase 1C2-like [Sycon ciliatum]|uniref:sulfotransferase 1C2-like n=1 Tax=Sycon ciliatum TaxID=27933 RepID=UPI0031F71F6D
MAVANSYVILNGKVEGCKSKTSWSPGDPLPWTANICQGVPFNIAIKYERCKEIPDFKTKADDVFIVTYPKSGTTWMQQIVKCLQTKGYPETVEKTVGELNPWFEEMEQKDADAMTSPRIFKSHSPYHMAAKGNTPDSKCKYLHVVRNPKDVCVSQYYHYKGFWEYEYTGEFPEFCDLFIHGQVECGSWFDFVMSWYTCSEEVLHITYEDLKARPAEVIPKVANFLGLECNDTIVGLTIEKSSFSKMKTDAKSNMTWMNDLRHAGAVPFMRKGKVGDWRGHFTEEQSQRLDAVFQEKSSAEMRIAFWGKDIAQTLEAVQGDADQESESPS